MGRRAECVVSEAIYAALDLELTGLKPSRDEITEIGIVLCTPQRVIERWSSLVRPQRMPPLQVQRLTGITPQMLSDAPTFDEIRADVERRLEQAVWIGHNVGFDQEALAQVGTEPQRGTIDTLPLAQIVMPAAPSHRLTDLCHQLEIAQPEQHRALADAEAARQLYVQLEAEYQRLPANARDRLTELSLAAGFNWGPGMIFREWSQQMPPGSTWVSARRQGPVYKSDPLAIPLPAGSLADLTEQVFIAAEAAGLERRDEQLEMTRNVASALQNGEHAIIEAGTGIGKSLAYLVPAALWALKTGARVAISTYSINLQHQLAEHEIPRLREMLVRVFPEADALSAEIVKGGANYLCRRKLSEAEDRSDRWDDPLLLARAIVWDELTDTGDREELRLSAVARKEWDRLSAERAACLMDGCEYVNDGTCYLAQLQGRAAEAHIILVNHALLMTELVRGSATKPPTPVVIVDEAHRFEDAATAALTREMDEAWLNETLDRASDTEQGEGGLAQRAASLAGQEALRLSHFAEAVQQPMEVLFRHIERFAKQHAQHAGDADPVTLTDRVRETPGWEEIQVLWKRTAGTLAESVAAIDELVETCKSRLSSDPLDPEQRELLTLSIEARNLGEDLKERMTALDEVVEGTVENRVTWVRRDAGAGSGGAIHDAPLNVAEVLAKLWSDQQAVLLTGATLTTHSSSESLFPFLRSRLGIEAQVEEQYGTPFDYSHRCRIYLPTDAVRGNDELHSYTVARDLPTLAAAVGGRTLALFRSNRAMREVAKLAEPQLQEAGLVLAMQGRDGSPTRVVETLRSDPRTVVFGVASMWQGIDVPGDALSLLIITRLPFVPPTAPIIKARSEGYENAFEEYLLPMAILEFRQGFGRLLRRQTDVGAVVVLDGRLRTYRYGEQFLNALPPAPILRMSTAAIAEDLRSFLSPEERLT